jgi:8-oxo-dGTP pyrophosphatase MutT (NUDIX family)
VLLVRRNPAARFMGGAWVFPGGALDAGEDHRAAGVREVAEEAGVALADPDELIELSRWITPAGAPVRYDTVFFLAPLPQGAAPRPDGAETVDHRLLAPRAALDAHARGELELVFPTVKHLEQLAGFASADELLAWAPGRAVAPVEPQVVRDGADVRIVLPGEPEYVE